MKQENNEQNPQTVIFLKNYGNLSGGIITRKLITPSRSVRSITGHVGSVRSTRFPVGSGNFQRGLPSKGQNFFNNNEVSFHQDVDKNNQTIIKYKQ